MSRVGKFCRNRSEYTKGITVLAGSAAAALALYSVMPHDSVQADTTRVTSSQAPQITNVPCTSIEKVQLIDGKPEASIIFVRNIGNACIGLYDGRQGPGSPSTGQLGPNEVATLLCLTDDKPFAAGLRVTDGDVTTYGLSNIDPALYDEFDQHRAEVPVC